MTQWFLEQSFSRDFVYRNPRGKKKWRELADAVVLFDDVALMVQAKAQCGKHDPVAWATEKILEALKQLGTTNDQLSEGGISRLDHEIDGTAPFLPAAYPHHIGLIVLTQENALPFAPTDLVPELTRAGFPVHVLSLRDLATITARFDTAGDFIPFMELRAEVMPHEHFSIHEEEENLKRLVPYVHDVLSRKMSPSSSEELEKTVAAGTRNGGRTGSRPSRWPRRTDGWRATPSSGRAASSGSTPCSKR